MRPARAAEIVNFLELNSYLKIYLIAVKCKFQNSKKVLNYSTLPTSPFASTAATRQTLVRWSLWSQWWTNQRERGQSFADSCLQTAGRVQYIHIYWARVVKQGWWQLAKMWTGAADVSTLLRNGRSSIQSPQHGI